MKKVAVIGAGPAGLTAAYELLSSGEDLQVIILEIILPSLIQSRGIIKKCAFAV